ncbi:acetyltransferase, GNAT family protein, partial [mine drainage metagenome]
AHAGVGGPRVSPQPAPAPAPDGDACSRARALAFSHLVGRRSATQVVRTPSGFAVLHRGFPDSTAHNRVVVTGAADPAATLALADRVLGGARLPHRHVAVDHDRIDRGWEDAFAAVGYAHGRLVLMAARSQPGRPAEAVVERLPYHQLAATVAAGWRRTLPDASEAVVQELVARRAATAAACTV